MREQSETDGSRLRDAHILAVEDDFLVSLDVACVLHDAGASAVRTCASVDEALETIDSQRFSAAVLDVRLGRETITPVARKLEQLGTPFLFYTGQVTTERTLADWPGVPIVSKPATPETLVDAVVDMLSSTVASRVARRV